MRKSLHLITLARFVPQIVGSLYNIQPSQPNKGFIIQPKDSTAKWQLTLDNRDNESNYSVAINGLLLGLNFSY